MKDLEGKCAFITGGASGIGLAIASAFGRAGVKLVIADIDQDGLDGAALRLRTEGIAVQTLRLNVTDAAAWQAAARRTEAAFGPVDILCNNAGVGSARANIELIADEDWNWVLGVNLSGVRNGIKTFLPGMKTRSRPAHIVNTASILGHFAALGVADYVTSKFAVLGLSEALRMELQGTPIGVSVLCPGLVATPLSQNARKALPSARTAGHTAVSAEQPPGIAPDHVGQCVVDAVRNGGFYIFTHPEYDEILHQRLAEISKAIATTPGTMPKDDLGYLGKGMLGLSKR
jgi:2-hydroxycyclohexanecarboxyl-CoA dehydrogenase